jgi:hypothetical protein
LTRIGDQTAGGSDQDQYWWCIKHNVVEQGPGCQGQDRLGPFASYAEASGALELARERTRKWDADED